MTSRLIKRHAYVTVLSIEMFSLSLILSIIVERMLLPGIAGGAKTSKTRRREVVIKWPLGEDQNFGAAALCHNYSHVPTHARKSHSALHGLI